LIRTILQSLLEIFESICVGVVYKLIRTCDFEYASALSRKLSSPGVRRSVTHGRTDWVPHPHYRAPLYNFVCFCVGTGVIVPFPLLALFRGAGLRLIREIGFIIIVFIARFTFTPSAAFFTFISNDFSRPLGCTTATRPFFAAAHRLCRCL
jgi:hypothetical protein